MPRSKYKPTYSDGDPFPGYYALVERFYYKVMCIAGMILLMRITTCSKSNSSRRFQRVL